MQKGSVISTLKYQDKEFARLQAIQFAEDRKFLLTDIAGQALLEIPASDVNALCNQTSISLPGQPLMKTDTQGFESAFTPIDDCSSILLDTTTVKNATDAISSKDSPTLTQLFDLNSLCFAALCFDKIILLPSKFVRRNPAPDMFRLLSGVSQDHLMGEIWAPYVLRFLGNDSLVKKLERAWTEILPANSDPVSLNFSRVEGQYHDSGDESIACNAYGLFHRLLLNDKTHRDDFLTVQTARAIFNFGLAQTLAIPYQGTAFRYPVLTTLQKILEVLPEGNPLRDGHETLVLKELAEYRCGNKIPGFRIDIPFPLLLVLSRMDTPEDFWDALRNRREEFRAIRKWFSEIGDEVENENRCNESSYLEKLRTLLQKIDRPPSIDPIQLIVSGSTGAIAIAAGLQNHAVIGGIIAATASIQWGLLAKKLRYKFFFDLREECGKIDSVNNETARLWGTNINSDDVHLANCLRG